MSQGDHIYVTRSVYTHHGIDAGDGTVIHFTGEPGSKVNASIARSSMEEFLQGGDCKVRRYGKRDDASTTIARAESQIGETGYHLIINNCEHFSTWCCTGLKASRQIRGATSLTAHGAVAGSTAAATGGVILGGMSGAGIMSTLSAAGGVIGLGAAAGPAVLATGPAALSVGITCHALRDHETLPSDERHARRDGRLASVAGAGAATAGGVAAISSAGVAGLSGAGITSGLAAIGGAVGGGMVAGTAAIVAAPALAAAGVGMGAFLLSRRLRRQAPTQIDVAETEAVRIVPVMDADPNIAV